MGHSGKHWVEREKVLEMLQSFVLLCWLLCCVVESGKFLHTLKDSKRQLSCVILPLEGCLFPLSVERISCVLHRRTQRKVPKWAGVQEPFLVAGL